MTERFESIHEAVGWVSQKLQELEWALQNESLQKKLKEAQQLEKGKHDLAEQNQTLQQELAEVQAQNKNLQKRLEEAQAEVTALGQAKGSMEAEAQSSRGNVEHTYRNILYSEEKQRKRLPVYRGPDRGANEVGSLVFGECLAVRDFKVDGEDEWLKIDGGDNTEQWVLGRDAGKVNCVDMTRFSRERCATRIPRSEYSGQDFPKKMYTEGFAGSSSNDICLISASGDSFWREINIEMLFRGIATATVFEEGWGGDETFTDWVAYYAVNCVQYGQLRTPTQKHLKVTVKPSSRWRQYQADCCKGPDLDTLRQDIGKAQCKECDWLKRMKDKLHVKWEDVEFLTGFAFLRAYCAWSLDDCKEVAKERFVWVLEDFFDGGYKEKALYELDRAYWLLDEAFDGCCVSEEALRRRTYTELWRFALEGKRLEVPATFHTTGAEPLAWRELAVIVGVSSTMDGAGRLGAGDNHCLALTTGTLRAWGHPQGSKQCRFPALARGESWVAVSAGLEHSLGLTTAGTLHTWGCNKERQCAYPALAPGERWVAVSGGTYHSLGLTSAGVLHAWGCNTSGQSAVPALPAGERWVAASAGCKHSLGLTASGELYVWGDNSCGQQSKPVLRLGERWAAVSAGDFHSLGLTVAGELRAWGENAHPQCIDVPELALGERWVAMSSGGFHSLGLTSAGALHAWGCVTEGQCEVPPGQRWIAVSAGSDSSLGLTANGQVLAWGWDHRGQEPHPEALSPATSRGSVMRWVFAVPGRAVRLILGCPVRLIG